MATPAVNLYNMVKGAYNTVSSVVELIKKREKEKEEELKRIERERRAQEQGGVVGDELSSTQAAGY